MQDHEAVDSYYQAWTELGGDLGKVPLADDFLFVSPVATLQGREQVQAMAAQFGPAAVDFRVREQFIAPGAVTTIVEWELPGVEGTTSAAELLTVRDGVIHKAELFYDPHMVIEFSTAANK